LRQTKGRSRKGSHGAVSNKQEVCFVPLLMKKKSI